jgi:hypothetical protein
MLAEHPSVLSVFELFNGLDVARRFQPEPLAGADFAELISAEQPFVTAVLRRGYPVAEITYPFGAGGRYRRDEPLPWILVAMLPRLSEDPDGLFDEVVAFASALPAQPPVAHYRALFAWLAARLEREVWIERSGSSIEYLGSLRAIFPDARFVHLHRDGPEAALSMREHHAYRLPISLLYGTAEVDPAAIELHAPPDGTDAISRILEARPSAELFGRYWTDQIVRGSAGRGGLDADRYLEIRFEDLVARPRETLAAVSAFFALDTGREDWTLRAAALVRGIPPTREQTLPRSERARLAEACREGRRLLGRAT